MSGVNYAIRDFKQDRRCSNTFKIASPPVKCIVLELNAFNNDEQIGIDFQNCIAGSLCSEAPIQTLFTTAPARRTSRFVVKVSADHGGVALVPSREVFP